MKVIKNAYRFLCSFPYLAIGIYAILFVSSVTLSFLGKVRHNNLLIFIGFLLYMASGTYVIFIYAIPFSRLFLYEHLEDEVEKKKIRQASCFLDEVLEHLYAQAFDAVRKSSMEQLNEVANIKLLQSQISPHFLYNTLDSVRGELAVRHMFDLADTIEALSCLFRFNIDQKKMLIPFEEELQNTERYIQIMQFRFANKFEFLKQFDESDERIMNYYIPKLTLQPIVENAIHHGLETKIGTGLITLRIQYTDKTLQIIIEDDGSGMNAEMLAHINQQLLHTSDSSQEKTSTKSGSGIALQNISERIRILYGEEYGISVASCPSHGTQVVLLLPLYPSNLPKSIAKE